MPQVTIPAHDARGRATAWVAAGVLVAVSTARWMGFAYPNYLAAVVFQCGVLALLLVLAYPSRQYWRRQRPNAAYLVAAYALYTALSALWAATPRLSAIGSLHALFVVTWALALGHLLRERGDVRLLLRGLFVAGVFAALVAIVRVGLEVASYYGVPLGPLDLLRFTRARPYSLRVALDVIEHIQGHRNYLAMFLLPPMLLGLADLLTPVLARTPGRGRSLDLPPRWAAAGVALMLIPFAVCQAWGAMLGLILGLACVLLAGATWRTRGWVLGGALVAAVACLIVLSQPAVTERLLRSPQATRWFMWQGALEMAAVHPLLGWGAGMFQFHFPDYRPMAALAHGWLRNITLYPHNEVLLVVVEGGLIGLGLYLAAHAALVWRLLRCAGVASDAPTRVAMWALVGALVAMFTHGLFEVGLHFWAPAVMYWTLIGIMIAIPRVEQQPASAPVARPRKDWDLTLFAGACLGVFVAAAGVIACGAQAEWLLGGALARLPAEQRTSEVVVRYQENAARLSRYLPDYMQALTRRADHLRESHQVEAALAAYEEIERIAPGYGPVRRLLASMHLELANAIRRRDPAAARAGIDEAVRLLRLSLRENPYDGETHVAMARALWMQSRELNLSEALDAARKAVELMPKNPEAHYLLAVLLEGAARRPEALAEFDAAAALYPPDSPMQKRIREMRNSGESPRDPK